MLRSVRDIRDSLDILALCSAVISIRRIREQLAVTRLTKRCGQLAKAFGVADLVLVGPSE